VGNEAAAFHSETKIIRDRFAPCFERINGWQMIEAVIELDRVEILRIKFEHFGGGKSLGIERAEPMPVIPARGADVNVCGHNLWPKLTSI
jgi:hypothetical protein